MPSLRPGTRCGNGPDAGVRTSPQPVASSPQTRPRVRSGKGDSSLAAKEAAFDPEKPEAMKTERPEPNAELQSFEPLRIAFAVLALLLGLVATLHF